MGEIAASMSEILGGLLFLAWTTTGYGQVGSSFGGRALISLSWRAMDCGLSPDHYLQQRRLGSPGTT